MTEYLLTTWFFLFVTVGVRLAMEIWIAGWKFDYERRAWRTMLHNRRLNERVFYLWSKSKIIRRRG